MSGGSSKVSNRAFLNAVEIGNAAKVLIGEKVFEDSAFTNINRSCKTY
jgi:hypothetical protein